MRKRDLARPCPPSAADDRGGGGRVVRVAERAAPRQRPVRDGAGDRVDHRDLERLGGVERRQDAGQPRSQHRLAGSRRPDHQHVVPARRGYFERALGRLLPLDIAQVGDGYGLLGQPRLGRAQNLDAAEVVDQMDQPLGREHIETARKGCLATRDRGADDPAVRTRRRHRREQHPATGRIEPSSASSPRAT